MSGKNAVKSYSLAFLYAYEGNIDRALELYKRAFRLSQNESLAIEIEEFIARIVEVEPQQGHLYLLLAAINEFKGDIESAKRDYQKFMDSIPVNETVTVKYIALSTRVRDLVLSNK
jgi:tetratricopeptide (TPR) repeat protein